MPGNRAQALVNGDEIFPDMLKAIGGARKTITFESYIYWSGETGAAFTQALIERAKAGVKVHLPSSPNHGPLQFAALRKKAYS